MRLWHEKLINKLPRQQLLGQHRECCALRGKGWSKKHKVVDYVFCGDFHNAYNKLYAYHLLVMKEMLNRGYKVEIKWFNISYRGLKLGFNPIIDMNLKNNIYKEHNKSYLDDCINNLRNKNIYLEVI